MRPLLQLACALLTAQSILADIPVISSVGTTFHCLQYEQRREGWVVNILKDLQIPISDFIIMNKFNRTLEGDILLTTNLAGRKFCVAGYFVSDAIYNK